MTDKDKAKRIAALHTEYVAPKRAIDRIVRELKDLGEKPKKLADLSVVTPEIEAAVKEALKEGSLTIKGLDKAMCNNPSVGFKDANELKEIHDALKEMGIVQIAHRFGGGVSASVELVPKE